jgi:hypothetical protein
MPGSRRKTSSKSAADLAMYLIPCSCGMAFSVSPEFDRQGSAWQRFLCCPKCGKRHDPRNRLLHLGYYPEGYWTVDDC